MGSREAGRFGTAICVCALIALSSAAVAQAKGTAYFVGNFDIPSVDARSIASDGSLSPLGTVPVGGTPRSIAITPDAKFAYVSDFGNDKILAYSIGVTGALTPLAGQPAGGFPIVGAFDPEGLATSPDGNFLFVADQGAPQKISAFSINGAGVLTEVAGSPFPAPGVDAIAVSGNGRFLYSTGGTTVRAWSITSGVLAMVGPAVSAGTNPKGIAVTPTNTHVLVLDPTAPSQIRSFAIGADGTPTAAGGPVPAGGAPDTLAVSQDGRFVYAANGSNPGTVSAYQIGADGSLTAVPNQPFTAGALSRGIDAGPDGRVYVGNYVGPVAPDFSTASVFNVGANGALSQVTNSPFTLAIRGVEFQSVAVTPNQGPTAAVTATPAPAGQPTALNASGSADSDGGAIARYDWDFGDGQTVANGGPTPDHIYAAPGTYTATVTVTDNEGCSTTVIFTGQTADCNGSAAATASTQVTVSPGGGSDAPDVRLSGGKTQKLDGAVEVGARCDEPCTADATGRLIVRTPSGGRISLAVKKFQLRPASAQLDGKKKKTLALRIPRKARRAGLRALKRGGRVRARITVTATNSGGGSETEKRTVRLVKR